jgi:hypothetical protein
MIEIVIEVTEPPPRKVREEFDLLARRCGAARTYIENKGEQWSLCALFSSQISAGHFQEMFFQIAGKPPRNVGTA